jgi:hypothetical protein
MDNQEDDKLRESFTPVLQGTTNGRLHSFHTAVKNPDNTAARVALTKIPKKIEALFILTMDDKDVGGALLTREELDINPRTAELTRREKDAMVKHWPRWVEHIALAKELKEARKQETAYAVRANLRGNNLKKRTGVSDDMPLADQAITVAQLLGKKAIDGAFGLAATGVEDVHTDPLAKELFATRTEYVRHYMSISHKLLDLGEKLRRVGDPSTSESTLPDEALDALRAANAALAGRKAD